MSDHPPRRPSRSGSATSVIGGFVALLWGVEVLDTVLGHRLDGYGVRPLSEDGLVGILVAPLLHGGWMHLVSNTIPLLVLGFLILLSGLRRWLVVTAIVWLAGGFGTWLIGGTGTNHIGASGLVFGWLTYLVSVGFWSRRPGQILLGLAVFLLYGGVLWGVLPTRPGISWQGHLCGALAGILAAWLVAGSDRQSRRRGDALRVG